MTYATSETSTYDGQPFFLYTFTKGATVNRFAAHDQDVTYDGNTYSKSAIRHEGTRTSGEMERVGIQIVLSKSDTFAQTYFSPDYSDVITITIFRGHWGQSDVQTMWKGRVIAYEARFEEILLSCESIQTTTRRAGLRGKYHRTCRHDLYGNGCGLDIANFYIDATVDSISDLDVTLTFASADEQADGYFKGGIMLKDGEYGFITKDVSNVVTLQYTHPAGLSVSDSVQLAPGCDLSKSTCKSKFNNLVNFGGFPFIPDKNVFTGQLNGRKVQ